VKLKTDCELVFFVSSSGHCTFDCQYCIVNPIVKHQPSLNYSDFVYLLDYFDNQKAFIALSGKGDFFASYPRSERLLARLLDHNVEIALDTNASILQDFKELNTEKMEKIRYINLTMHYQQIKGKKLQSRWIENTQFFLEKRYEQVHPDYIMSPLLQDEWDEALSFYKQNIFDKTDKKVLMVRDINQPFSSESEQYFQQLADKYDDMIAGKHQEDFSKTFTEERVLCPAGHKFFRIWNDGQVQGCPNLPDVKELYDNGNLKQRNLQVRQNYFVCSTPNFCDCHVIGDLGMMKFVESKITL